jgi:integrase
VAVTEITRQRVKERRNEIVHESGAVSANRALCALSSFFGWVIDQQHITGANPTLDIKPLHEEDRSRVLGEAELVDIWLACGDDAFGHIVKLLMLTGQRRQEIGHLEWAEIFAEKRQIVLPPARTFFAFITPLRLKALWMRFAHDQSLCGACAARQRVGASLRGRGPAGCVRDSPAGGGEP